MKKVVENRQRQSLYKQIQIRRVELGVQSRLMDGGDLIISDQKIQEISGLFDPEDEDEHEQALLFIVMKMYTRASKMLYGRYARWGKKIESLSKEDFEKARLKKQQLLEGQAIKLLRDNKIGKELISTAKAKHLYALIVQKFKTTHLDYELYLNFLFQVAMVCFGKGKPQDLSRFPSAISLKTIYEHFAESDVIPRAIY